MWSVTYVCINSVSSLYAPLGKKETYAFLYGTLTRLGDVHCCCVSMVIGSGIFSQYEYWFQAVDGQACCLAVALDLHIFVTTFQHCVGSLILRLEWGLDCVDV